MKGVIAEITKLVTSTVVVLENNRYGAFALIVLVGMATLAYLHRH